MSTTEKVLEHLRSVRMDGVFWFAEQQMNKAGDDPHGLAQSILEIARMLNEIKNITIRDAYQSDLRKEFKIRVADFKAAFDQIAKEKRKTRDNNISSRSTRADDYELPKAVLASGGNFDMYESSIVNYGVFSHLNVIYAVNNPDSEGKKHFKEVSNFTCEIINHMEDEKIPTRLVRIENHERVKVFDIPFDAFLSKNGFMKMVEAFGNFQFDGSEKDYLRLKSKLMDEMGDGRKIDVLGWQDEGFWAFNNCIVYEGEVLHLDKNGMIEVDGITYYIPSGNSIYKRNPNRFVNQKKVEYKQSSKTFKWLLAQGAKVHRERFYHAILFSIAGCFRDLIHGQLSWFPILFLYGDASTGKDNLVEFCQSLFGDPQEALVMTGRDNTAKAKIRELAQFQNMPAHFSEYKAEPETDDMLKKLWDGRGYKRGTIDSAFSNETVPVRCPIIVTSNNYPHNDAVITRLVAMEFHNKSFTQAEVDEYDLLKETLKKGVSGFLPEILSLREKFKTDFLKVYKEVTVIMKKDNRTLTMPPRMIQNVAVLGASMKIAQGKIPFPFSFDEWLSFALNSLEKQEEKRSSGGVVQTFFEILLDLMRDKHEPIEHELEYRITDSQLMLRISHIHSKYSRKHYATHRESGLSKSVLIDSLKKCEPFIDDKDSIRYGKAKSSGMIFDLNLIHNGAEILEWHEKLMSSRRQYHSAGSGVPKSGDDDDDDDDNPF